MTSQKETTWGRGRKYNFVRRRAHAANGSVGVPRSTKYKLRCNGVYLMAVVEVFERSKTQVWRLKYGILLDTKQVKPFGRWMRKA